mmetsp:Transcript_3692/g.10676  ORF Transcript_3692/g.10676 Transcript_3692/m.10676 type:complete len:204 (+) Transcript_3692:466-1077(+)
MSRRRATRRSASRLCSSSFMRRLCSAICSTRSSSANFAMSSARIESSSVRAIAAFSSFARIWKTYAFFISSLSSIFFRIFISSTRRAAASSSSPWSSLRRCSSSSFSLLFAIMPPIILFIRRVFSLSASSFSAASLSSRARLSAAYCSILLFSSISCCSIWACVAFCSIMNFRRIAWVSCCFSERALCSAASSAAIFSTSSAT